MKICITARGNTLESEVDPRFGRCAWFIIVEPDSMNFEAIENPLGQSTGGAGIQAGQLMAENGVDAVLTGNTGPNAFQTLKVANVNIITGVSGKVIEAVEMYKKGQFQSTEKPTVDSHFGMKGGE
ncbi:NifB/NifX family molybdenum-iron cluster-binding protein [bacterium]